MSDDKIIGRITHRKDLNLTGKKRSDVGLNLSEQVEPKLASLFSIHSESTIKQVDQILDYTDDEKKQIDELMKKVHKIDALIESGRPYANTMVYNMFILSYKKIDDRIKKHFLVIYNDLIIKTGIFKINRVLNGKPLSSGGYDSSGIKAEIINILSINNNFDFGIFNNELVNKLVDNIKNK